MPESHSSREATPSSSPPRLKATRTYGRQRARLSSPEYGTPALSWSTLLSSPMPSSLLVTPSPPRKRARVEVQDDEEESEDSGILAPPVKVEKKVITLLPALKLAPAKQGTLKGFFTAAPRPKPKQPLQPAMTVLAPTTSTSTPTSQKAVKPSTFQQSHLMHLPLLQSCKPCGMTYVRGGEDEGVHARHHGRVMNGIPWEGLGKGTGKGKGKGTKGDKGWREVSEVSFGSGSSAGKGRVVVCDGSWGGAKLDDILHTVDVSLSSPALPPAILERCRIFLLLTSSPPPPRTTSGKRQRLDPLSKPARLFSGSPNERIVSVVVAQGIKWAMRVLPPTEAATQEKEGRVVDSGGGVMCDPHPLDTPLGIHRLYTIPSYRSLGLAQALLEATRDNTVYGCAFDPAKGEVAFSQPTESGRAVMEKWGGGAVRVFVDDESQN